MPDTQLIPPACVAAVRTNDFGPDYAEKIARAVLDAFVAGEGAGRWRVVCDPDDSVNEYLVVTGHGSGGMRCLHCGTHHPATEYDDCVFRVDWNEKRARAVAAVLNYLEAKGE